MTLSTTTLTRAAGLSAIVGGLLFIGVQINHPHLDVSLVTTTEWTIRESMKAAMAVLSLIGITGMYLRQVRQSGVPGLVAYLLYGAAFLIILSFQVVGICVLPTIAGTAPDYVNDILAVAAGGRPVGDVGLIMQLNLASAAAYIGGGFLFGLALYRAKVLSRWAAALLAVGSFGPALIPLLPQINERIFAVPPSIALIGLGYSLWRQARTTSTTATTATPAAVRAADAQLDPAGAK